MTKCDFCAYKVGNECVVATATGQVPEYRCKQAIYEYNKWLQQQKYNKKKKPSWR
jgi:hypothetical protein